MKYYVLMLFLALQTLYGYSQNIFNGVVRNAEDKSPVQYVSIGLTTKPNGTVSNAAGLFSITLGDKINNSDTLKFSSIGYQSEVFSIGQLKMKLKSGPLTILLKKSVQQLEQVSVISKKAKLKILGYDINSKLFGFGVGSSGVGSQAGVVIPIKHPDTNIESLSFFIIQNSFKHLVLRLNIYKMEDNKPGNNILKENIYIKIENMQTGKMVFDLTKYNLYVSKNVLVALEWIEAQPEANSILNIGATLFGHTYFMPTSQYTWTKKSVGLGISVKTYY